MCSDFYLNEQIFKAVGCVFNRRQSKPIISKRLKFRTKSFVLADANNPYGNGITPSTADFSGHWAHCKAGDKPPLGALQAPDKFNSHVCIWPEKDFTLGRACTATHAAGLDAWFPFCGFEYSAKDYSIRFDVLVDDGKTSGLYAWTKVARLSEQDAFKPLVVHGLSPIVVNNLLGKGSPKHLTAWTSEAGKEVEHTKDEVLRALVLCVRQPRDETHDGWREVHIHEPARVTETMVRSECIAKVTQIGNNESDKAKALKIPLKFTSEEGQSWKCSEMEECDLRTVIKSENVLRKLAEAQLPIGLALYATDRQVVDVDDVEIVRNYEVPPLTKMTVTLSVYRQEVVLDCPAMEHVYTSEGKLVLKRLVDGRWRAVSTRYINADVVETFIQVQPRPSVSRT